jgi:hypothetical protein
LVNGGKKVLEALGLDQVVHAKLQQFFFVKILPFDFIAEVRQGNFFKKLFHLLISCFLFFIDVAE